MWRPTDHPGSQMADRHESSVRVAIDVGPLSDGSQYRGIGTYLRELLAGLEEANAIDVVKLKPQPRIPFASKIGRITPWVLRYQADRRLRADLRASAANVFHSPGQAPPRTPGRPWVQTLHDLTPLAFPQFAVPAERRSWQAVGARVRSADRIVCPSASAADQGVRLLGLDPSRVVVIPLGVTNEFSPEGPRYEGSDPYLLWVSAWGPHKGFAEATAILANLRDLGFPHRLLVIGHQDSWMLDQIKRAAADRGVTDRVVVLNHIPEVASVYRGADALLMTSRAEGFGLPALEAMACGVPVVAFRNTSLPEVLGSAGVLVEDGDIATFSHSITTILSNPALAADLSGRGLERAAAFTWSRTVRDHVEVYLNVVQRASRS